MLGFLILTPLIVGTLGIWVRFKKMSGVIFSISAALFAFCLQSVIYPSHQDSRWNFLTLGGYPISLHWQSVPIANWMACLTTLINLLAQVYSAGYFSHDARRGYFQSVLLAFTGAMLCTVFGDNLFTQFVGWELMGVGSYLLIGYFRCETSARYAASKAMLVTRIGDVCFLIAVALAVIHHDNTITAINLHGTAFIAWALIGAVAAKSAQGPYASWLVDAMAGPTPASALIHAATMVAAGPYLLIRYTLLLHHTPGGLVTLMILGGSTAVLAAMGAVGSQEIKKLLAFSTVSQLGMMILAIGMGSPRTAWNLLVAHAFYKALLFFVSGIASYRAQSGLLSRMAGSLHRFEFSALFMMGALGVSGLPPTGGFLAKEALYQTASHGLDTLMLDLLLSFLGGAYTAKLVKALIPVKAPPVHRTSYGMLIPSYIISGLVLINFFWHPWVSVRPIFIEQTWPSLLSIGLGATVGAFWTIPFPLLTGVLYPALWRRINQLAQWTVWVDHTLVQGTLTIVTVILWANRLVRWGGSGRAQRYALLSGIALLAIVIWNIHV
ncbi:NADH-quinone oxidoreductase subunit L [Sulfobacillus sp. hq2]|uniref:NADH-quinone oxidoreductase subunit 5 family protein n=1 Tax=Sulfobacillus TaxID=28033 RepID=UPI001FA92609|nr:proton-conducting transporter membrane subunit [Sulfobacillus sp. hq2]